MNTENKEFSKKLQETPESVESKEKLSGPPFILYEVKNDWSTEKVKFETLNDVISALKAERKLLAIEAGLNYTTNYEQSEICLVCKKTVPYSSEWKGHCVFYLSLNKTRDEIECGWEYDGGLAGIYVHKECAGEENLSNLS